MEVNKAVVSVAGTDPITKSNVFLSNGAESIKCNESIETTGNDRSSQSGKSRNVLTRKSWERLGNSREWSREKEKVGDKSSKNKTKSVGLKAGKAITKALFRGYKWRDKQYKSKENMGESEDQFKKLHESNVKTTYEQKDANESSVHLGTEVEEEDVDVDVDVEADMEVQVDVEEPRRAFLDVPIPEIDFGHESAATDNESEYAKMLEGLEGLNLNFASSLIDLNEGKRKDDWRDNSTLSQATVSLQKTGDVMVTKVKTKRKIPNLSKPSQIDRRYVGRNRINNKAVQKKEAKMVGEEDWLGDDSFYRDSDVEKGKEKEKGGEGGLGMKSEEEEVVLDTKETKDEDVTLQKESKDEDSGDVVEEIQEVGVEENREGSETKVEVGVGVGVPDSKVVDSRVNIEQEKGLEGNLRGRSDTFFIGDDVLIGMKAKTDVESYFNNERGKDGKRASTDKTVEVETGEGAKDEKSENDATKSKSEGEMMEEPKPPRFKELIEEYEERLQEYIKKNGSTTGWEYALDFGTSIDVESYDDIYDEGRGKGAKGYKDKAGGATSFWGGGIFDVISKNRAWSFTMEENKRVQGKQRKTESTMYQKGEIMNRIVIQEKQVDSKSVLSSSAESNSSKLKDGAKRTNKLLVALGKAEKKNGGRTFSESDREIYRLNYSGLATAADKSDNVSEQSFGEQREKGSSGGNSIREGSTAGGINASTEGSTTGGGGEVYRGAGECGAERGRNPSGFWRIQSTKCDVNTVSTLFKMYLRDLPESLLTNALAAQFRQLEQAHPVATTKEENEINHHNAKFEELGLLSQMLNAANPASPSPACSELPAADYSFIKTRSEWRVELAKLMARLPPANYALLEWISRHLARVNFYSKINKMTLSNLTLIFCATLRISTRILYTLVLHTDVVFPPKPPESLQTHIPFTASQRATFLMRNKDRILDPKTTPTIKADPGCLDFLEKVLELKLVASYQEAVSLKQWLADADPSWIDVLRSHSFHSDELKSLATKTPSPSNAALPGADPQDNNYISFNFSPRSAVVEHPSANTLSSALNAGLRTQLKRRSENLISAPAPLANNCSSPVQLSLADARGAIQNIDSTLLRRSVASHSPLYNSPERNSQLIISTSLSLSLSPSRSTPKCHSYVSGMSSSQLPDLFPTNQPSKSLSTFHPLQPSPVPSPDPESPTFTSLSNFVHSSNSTNPSPAALSSDTHVDLSINNFVVPSDRSSLHSQSASFSKKRKSKTINTKKYSLPSNFLAKNPVEFPEIAQLGLNP
ncbi:putative Rho-type GTPase-activating protein 2 [Zancudomyces culisetae]|uniref:Putative Rho-type GTPase-activating protein 2 n=1 Tax=Zancudomyces culisetae TaxID=1213189 RepID=A0A1R1PKU1_ZANCU|nr:putative Rho-type GTPase-activating protein 2 [Zancudomyces culisetae]|eukprot:OMH81543.1 putative Rho-type GTPase-activating protein 2 [Zancudomyces culisetae]